MGNLRNEINDMLDIFDSYNIPEERQKEIITNGIFYCFSFGTDRWHVDRHFDCFKVARLLQFCKNTNMEIDVNKLVVNNDVYEQSQFMDLIHSFDELDKTQEKQRKKTK